VPSADATDGGAIVNCVAYAQGRRVGPIAIDDISEAIAVPGQFVWIGLREPGEPLLRTLQQEFGLHELAVEDALSAHQRPKIERYGDSLFVVLRTLQGGRGDDGLQLGETHLFMGPRYLVSVRHGPSQPYAPVRARCEAAPALLARGPAFGLYALMDFIVDGYFPVVAALEDRLETLEEELFERGFGAGVSARVYRLKRDLLEARRAVAPLVEVCNRLVRFDEDLVPEDIRPYFRDVYDHVVRLAEMVDVARELLTAALEAGLATVSVAQNRDTRRLAGWAAIIAVPTMIAGIYGMNFERMPELRWPWGYPGAMAVMVGACGLLYWRFRRAGWL
jgi:magnesium transporter